MIGLRPSLIAATMIAALALGAAWALPANAGSSGPGAQVSATQWTNANAASAAATNQLNAVSCSSSTFCVAVGQQNEETGGGVLIEQWNGTSWAVVPNVSVPFSANDSLNGVSCVGPSFCITVGSDSSAVSFMWNGTAWSAVAVPEPAGLNGEVFLSSVSCVAANLCESLGTGFAGSTPVVFGEQWNGLVWSLVPAATPPAAGANSVVQASGMDCFSATDCIAVGNSDGNGSSSAPFSELWNGTSWSLNDNGVDPSLPVGSFLSSVSCAGTSYCQAVGRVGGSPTQNLIESWNGQQWSVEPGTPQTSAGESQALTGVDCFSATSCSAVGWANASGGPSPASLALSWDGTSWSIVPQTPNPGDLFTKLAGETCLTDWACIAVGQDRSSAFPSVPTSFAMSAPIARSGYRFVASDGGVFAYGPGAPFLGSTGGMPLNAPVVGMGVMPAGDGYYLVASDGGIFNFGSAQFFGSTGGTHLNKPVVGMAVTPDGGGYWLVASDGGIFNYGDAQFYGSRGGQPLDTPIVGMAATTDGKGYFLVSSDGGIFTYGDAEFNGSLNGVPLNEPIVGISVPTSGGYYMVASDGGIFSFPAGATGPPFYGSTGGMPLNKPIVGMAAVQGGYYLSGSDGGIFAFTSPGGGLRFYGSTGALSLNTPIVGIAS